MCSLCAAVQGMDETANNGAQVFYLKRFNILPYSKGGRFTQKMTDDLTGLVVGAPYLACAVLGCWLTAPLNSWLGRRGTIFVSCAIAAIASVWEGVANSWVNLFIARFVLGLGIGSKSTTVPVYAAEVSPYSFLLSISQCNLIVDPRAIDIFTDPADARTHESYGS